MDRYHFRKTYPIKAQSYGAWSSFKEYSTKYSSTWDYIHKAPPTWQHDCLNTSWTKTIPIEKPKWMAESPRDLNLHKELKTTRDAERGINSLPRKRAYQLVIQCHVVSPENIQMGDITHTEPVIQICIYTRHIWK